MEAGSMDSKCGALRIRTWQARDTKCVSPKASVRCACGRARVECGVRYGSSSDIAMSDGNCYWIMDGSADRAGIGGAGTQRSALREAHTYDVKERRHNEQIQRSVIGVRKFLHIVIYFLHRADRASGPSRRHRTGLRVPRTPTHVRRVPYCTREAT